MTVVKILGLTEVCQVLVVSKDLDGERGTMEVVPSGLQGADDGEEFTVINVIVSFCRDEQLKEVRVRMPVTVDISLEEDGARGILGCIGGDGKGFGKVRKMENRSQQEEPFEQVK